MAALNYYIGLQRGSNFSPENVTAGTASAGTAVDVEINMQINNGTNATGLRRKEVLHILKVLEAYIISGGPANAGTYLPAG